MSVSKIDISANFDVNVARRDTSAIQIKNKHDLCNALTNRVMLDTILKQGLDYILTNDETNHDKSRFDQLQDGRGDKIVDYFMNIKDKIELEELRFY